jgi:hypothetical protein
MSKLDYDWAFFDVRFLREYLFQPLIVIVVGLALSSTVSSN